ncbi:MAG: SPFH/Band 7/PHB domain protein [Chloroflexota bacterium]|nr:SPFH/Band 7/PHB domain protein [Chloroflexota bacterium]
MANAPSATQLAQGISQLAQVRAAIEEVTEVFGSKDPSGRTPIVVVPKRQNRIRWSLVVLGLIVLGAGIGGAGALQNGVIGTLAVVFAAILIFLGLLRAFYVQIPEGVNALLARAGKHIRTVGPGLFIIPPWVVVSHLVTRREIPYDAPVKEAPTKDNVRATVDTSITFMVTDPYRFVYSISASGFDQVFQAACQDALRSMVRLVTSDQVNDLARQETAGLREALSSDVEQYGVTITKINITDARPPAEFLRSQEARQLAVLQRAEQAEQQALAQRRQADQETLARQQVVARVEREREELQVQVQQAEARRRIAELDAEAEMVRLSRVEEGLRNNPLAAQRELQLAQLEVARSLAANSRAVLQVGSADDLVRAFVMREVLHEAHSLPAESAQADGHDDARPA